MDLIIIAAMNTRRVIGSNGSIPWNIPEDLRRFKQLTTGHTVLMGRKTFDSIGRALPDRRTVVISKSPHDSPGAEYFDSMESALAAVQNDGKVYVIGGGEIFRQLLESADELVLTIVENELAGDTHFPPYEHLVGTMFTRRSIEQQNGYRYETFVRSAGRPAIR